MDKQTWNKLFRRALRAFSGKPIAEIRRLKRDWLIVLQRKTGKQCFFVAWD